MEVESQLEAPRWWERRWLLALAVLLTAVPLLYPQIPPLVDLPGHIGRYRVELDLQRFPSLQNYFGFHWVVMGNLGVDLLILPLAPLIGLEPAVKLIMLLVPPMTAAGFLWVAREVHGRVPPTALFALPFVYNFPFLFGFANYSLSAAIAFLAFGLWLRLSRLGRIRMRNILFVPISVILFFCHVYGWALLGLMCFSAEVVRIHDAGRHWYRASFEAVLNCVVLAFPIVVALAWPGGDNSGFGIGWFDWDAKWIALMGILRDRWGPFDVASVELAGVIFLFALASPKLSLSRGLVVAAALLLVSFVVLPRYV